MIESEVSIGLFQDIEAELNNYDLSVQSTEGLLWRRLTDIQNKLMVDLRCKRITYMLYLWPGKKYYPIDDWVMEVMPNMRVNRDDFRPLVTLPAESISEDRRIIIQNYDTIQDGDVLILTVYRRPIGEKVDRATKPMVDSIFHQIMVDYVLSFYRKNNEEFKTREEVLNEAKKVRDRVNGLDATIFYPSNFVKF